MTIVPHSCVSTCFATVASVGKWKTSPDDMEEAAGMYLVLTGECIPHIQWGSIEVSIFMESHEDTRVMWGASCSKNRVNSLGNLVGNTGE